MSPEAWLAPAGEASGEDEEGGGVEEGSAGHAAEQIIELKWSVRPCKQEDLVLFKETVLASGFSLPALQVGARHETGRTHVAHVEACPSFSSGCRSGCDSTGCCKNMAVGAAVRDRGATEQRL